MAYENIYINDEGKVFVDGAGGSSGVVSFADGLNRGFGSSILTETIYKILKKPLRFGNQEQIKALKAYQVITIQRELDDNDFFILGF